MVAVVAAAAGLSFNRPVVLHPATLVDVVDIEVAIESAASPQEAVEAADLKRQLTDLLALRRAVLQAGGTGGNRVLPDVPGRAKRAADRRMHAIAAERHEVANLTVLNPVKQLAAGLAVTAHQPDADFEVFLFGFLAEGQHLPRAGTIDGDRLLHEDVDALFDGVF